MRQVHRFPADVGADAVGGFQAMQERSAGKGESPASGFRHRPAGRAMRARRERRVWGFGLLGGLLQKCTFWAASIEKTMNLHEFSGQADFAVGPNINTPRASSASAQAAADAARELGGTPGW